MIEPMKKYSFLVFHNEYENFLNDMREIGVLHIIEKDKSPNNELQEKFEYINNIKNVIRLLLKREVEKKNQTAQLDGATAFNDVQQLIALHEEKKQKINNLTKEISQSKPWGIFSNDAIDELISNNINIRFFSISARKFDKNWLNLFPIEVISTIGGQVYFVMFGQDDLPESIPAEPVARPKKSLKDLMSEKEKTENDVAELEEKLDKHAAESLDAIDLYCRQLIEEADYTKAIRNTSSELEEKVMLLEGWIPQKKEELLTSYLEKHSVLFISKDAVKEDMPPVALRNNKFTEKFETITELYALPKYGELDLTPFFAPFYALFFGFCLGDIGYGILIVLISLFAKPKVRKEIKQVLGLVFYLGLTTILFGVIGGTFFGIPLYDTNIPLYVALSAKLDSSGSDINNFLFNLSLAFGAVQILFGMMLKTYNGIRQLGWKMAVGSMGWLLLLLGSGVLYAAGNYSEIDSLTITVLWRILFVVSGSMILLFNDLTRNVFKNFGLGLWNSYNMLTGLLGDLLSYIRLFALGISSAILGFVFNSLAISMSGDIPVLNIVIMVVILVIGHGINLFMSGIGAFVHPLRLTFVEFYKNAGFSGGGKKYNPFRKIN